MSRALGRAPSVGPVAPPASLEFCQRLPKVEVHAHLHGCIRESTLDALLAQHEAAHGKGRRQDALTFKHGDRTLTECFQVFDLIHKLVCHRDALDRVTREAVQDFANDNVMYVELRTTPRPLPGGPNGVGALSKREYVDVVMQTMAASAAQHGIVARLLLSVDRTQPVQEALDTVRLAHTLLSDQAPQDRVIVGIDFCGNPTKNTFRQYAAAFALARQYGLRTTVHCGEVQGTDEDTDFIIKQFVPDRLGHAVILSPSATAHLLEHPIPIEICPTSNVKTRAVPALAQHPFGRFFGVQYPLLISTDDMGVFNSPLSREHYLMACAFSITEASMLRKVARAIPHTFAHESVKRKLLLRLQRFATQHGHTLEAPLRSSL